jgi:hypothetical protein
MRDIRVDDEVYQELGHRAVPLEDANAVLRRVLGLDAARVGDAAGKLDGSEHRQAGPPRRARRGELLLSEAYIRPILQTLADRGGQAAAGDVLQAIEPELELTPVDHELLKSGVVRWKNRAQFVRLRLVNSGDLASDSPYGIWEITRKGRNRLAAMKQDGKPVRR